MAKLARDERQVAMNPPWNTLRQKQAGPFRIVEKSYGGNAMLASHAHPTAFLSFLLAGAYVEATNRGETVCPAGTVIWHPPAETHSDRFDCHGGHLIDLEVADWWLRDVAQDLRPAAQPRIFCAGLPYALGLRLYRELSAETTTVEDIATELLSFFFSGGIDRTPPAWFHRALQLVNETEGQHQSLGSVAHEVGVHPVHLARSFRRFLGCTFGDHVTKRRVRRAFELLLNSNRPIVDVAYSCGFADHAHLCRTFKKSTGLTPTAFRDIVLGERASG
jgi:AraC family transcriptional regulator